MVRYRPDASGRHQASVVVTATTNNVTLSDGAVGDAYQVFAIDADGAVRGGSDIDLPAPVLLSEAPVGTRTWGPS